jgi:MFS family permease
MAHMSQTGAAPDDARAKRNVAVLVAAQAILGAQMPMIFTVGGLAGQSLAPNPCLATLPISMVVLGSMLTAQPMSAFMARNGRRMGFVLGAWMGAGGAAVASAGLWIGSFAVFCAGALLMGIYMGTQGFYRFAATDSASPAFRPKAISYVMAGGLVSAIIGPQIVKLTAEAFVIPFLGVFLAVVVLNVLGSTLFAALDIPRLPTPAADAPKGRSKADLLRVPRIRVAVICGLVSYALMNLVMTSTPLAVVGCGFTTGNAADIVSAHVLAMYTPSFFTGHLIARFGVERILAAGLAILAGAGVVALAGVELGHFYLALVLLGLGWNFGFIGATAMLTAAHRPEERGAVQGLNDMLVFGGVTVASLASGGLMNCSGGDVLAGWTAVNLAMAPFLVLAGGSMIWLWMRPKAA